MDANRSTLPTQFNTAIWCLRLTIVAQCVGISGRYLFAKFETESPIYGLLFFDLDFAEVRCQFLDDFGVYGCLVAGVITIGTGIFSECFRPTAEYRKSKLIFFIDATALGFVAVWTLGMAIAETIRGDVFARFTLLEEAVRIASPLVLIIFLATPKMSCNGLFRRGGMLLLLIATATTFAFHGYKAIELYGTFLDYLLLSQPFGITLVEDQRTAELILTVIGWVDIGLAISLLVFRYRAIAIYMAAWGFLTALSRMTAGGWEAWPEVFIRAANAGAPLTLFFLFQLKFHSRNKIDLLN